MPLFCEFAKIMACLNTLKQEIKAIQNCFPRKPNARFQVLSASLDEITCRFTGLNGKKHDIHANITVRHELTFNSV